MSCASHAIHLSIEIQAIRSQEDVATLEET